MRLTPNIISLISVRDEEDNIEVLSLSSHKFVIVVHGISFVTKTVSTLLACHVENNNAKFYHPNLRLVDYNTMDTTTKSNLPSSTL